MAAGARTHNCWSGDNGDLAASAMCTFQFLGYLANNGRLGFLGINDVVNELKRIRMRGGSLHRHNSDSLVSDNNLVTFFDVEKLNGPRSGLFPVNGDCAIDDPGRHLDLLAVEANERLLVGRDVEVGRENTVGWSRGKLSACPLHYFCALLPKPQDQLV